MKNHFNKNYIDYVNARPSYPKEIFINFSKYFNLNEKSKCLEIGAGHGIATQIIASLWNPNITAIEPGESLFNIAQEQLYSFPKIVLINESYENFKTETKYDCIYAATAFHWIDAKIKFSKSYELLNDNGVLFLFWNYFDFNSSEVRNSIQHIYRKYHPLRNSDINPKTAIRNKILERQNEINRSKYFKHLNHFEVVNPVKYTAANYIKLLKTFPNNSFSSNKIDPFFNAIENYIKDKGNNIDIDILVCSEIAQKI